MAEQKEAGKKMRKSKGTQTPPLSKGKFQDNIFQTDSEISKQPSENIEQLSKSSEQSSESLESAFKASRGLKQSEKLDSDSTVSEEEEEEEEGETQSENLKDEIGISGKVDVRLSPSQRRATKPAINDSPSNRDSIGFTPYENKDDMATIEKNHFNSTWDDLKSGFNGDYKNIEHIYQQLMENEEVNNFLSQLNGPIRDYFSLTRLLYD
jgi:hypothetical protein